jgi:hypothetical protein
MEFFNNLRIVSEIITSDRHGSTNLILNQKPPLDLHLWHSVCGSDKATKKFQKEDGSFFLNIQLLLYFKFINEQFYTTICLACVIEKPQEMQQRTFIALH